MMRSIPSNMFKLSSHVLTDRSKAVVLFRIISVICVSCLSLSYCLVCSLQPCDHLLGKGWPIGSLVCDGSLCLCHFPLWCPGSDVLLDCIDSWGQFHQAFNS